MRSNLIEQIGLISKSCKIARKEYPHLAPQRQHDDPPVSLLCRGPRHHPAVPGVRNQIQGHGAQNHGDPSLELAFELLRCRMTALNAKPGCL